MFVVMILLLAFTAVHALLRDGSEGNPPGNGHITGLSTKTVVEKLAKPIPTAFQ